jgi:hypothetical protein
MTDDFHDVAEWVAERAGCSIPNFGAGLGQIKDGTLNAGVMYESYTGASVTATIAIEHGAIIAREFLAIIFDYPFNQLKVKKIFAMVSATNQRSIDFIQRCGFEEETRVKDYYESGDAIVFACTRDTCRWLTLH